MKVIAYLLTALVIAAGLGLPGPAFAQTKPVMNWAGDAEGGAPYQFPDPNDPSKIIGFEVDIAEALAQRMGRTAKFTQNQWDSLVPGLGRNEYDMVIAGLEVTPERLTQINFSTPYYISTLSLTVRLDESRIRKPEDLPGHHVGTLKATLAERYLNEMGGVDVPTYDNQLHPYVDLLLGRLDAVLLDTPITLYYAYSPRMRNVELTSVKFPIAIGIRKADTALLADVNVALEAMKKDGTLKAIYQRWGMYNSSTADYLGDKDPVTNPNPVRYEEYLRAVQTQRTFKERLEQYVSFLPLLLRGAAMTVALSIAAMALAVSLGLLLAVARAFGSRIVVWPVIAFIEIIRGTPLLIQLFIIFYGLPTIGIRLSPFWAAVLGLGVNYSAYEAENYRAGIQSIPKGHHDAALSLGLTRAQTIRKIVLPQAVRLVIPPVTNDFIALLKDSSLVSVITMVELTKVYNELASTYFDYIGLGLLAASIYFIMGLPIARLSRYMEARLAYMKAY
jgi:polar amino acid transport system substrate-binding protein